MEEKTPIKLVPPSSSKNMISSTHKNIGTTSNTRFSSILKFRWLILGLIIFILVIAGTVLFLNQNRQTICTQEAKKCPNGSYVSRFGPKCEFAKCSQTVIAPKIQLTNTPTPTPIPDVNPKAYINQKYGYSLTYLYPLKPNPDNKSSNSVEFYKSNALPGGVTYPAYFVYVIPDQQDYYSYIFLGSFFTPSVVTTLFSDSQGAIRELQDPSKKQSLSIRKISDSTIDGIKSVTIEQLNKNASNATGENLKNEMILLRRNSFTYLIGVNYSTDKELNDFDNLLSSFKLINISNNPDYWNSISDPLSTIKYPTSWFTYFNQNTQCLELSDIQNIQNITQASLEGHALVQVRVYLGHMSQSPYGSDTKNYSINGLSGATAMKQSKIVSGLTEHIMLQSKSGNEYAEFINESGDAQIFHQIVSALKFNR